jgi:hypothetical protein
MIFNIYKIGEFLRNKHIKTCLKELKESDTFSIEELEIIQNKRLKSLLLNMC